jgi:hypothetical protein
MKLGRILVLRIGITENKKGNPRHHFAIKNLPISKLLSIAVAAWSKA